MFSHTLPSLAPEVHLGLHGRIHITFGPNAPGLVGTRAEMQRMADQIHACCNAIEPLITGDIQSCNDDLHPREEKRA